MAEHSEDESLGYSAHIVIDLRHDKMIAGSYRCALEKMPNISRALVVNFINKLLLRHAKDAGTYTYINKKKESVSYRPRISIMTLASSSLREDLVKGYVSSVELVNNSAAFQGLDQGNRIIKAQSRLMLKIGSENSGNPFLAWLKEITHRAREGGWDQIQVNIRGLPSGRSASPTFDTVVEDAADVLYAQSEVIDGFGVDLQQCYAEICPEVVSRVWLLVGDDRVWVKI